MIKGLRKKFILVAMCSMFFVLVTAMLVLNAANYRNLLKKADRLLTMIEGNGGTFPDPPTVNRPGETGSEPGKYESSSEEDPSEKKGRKTGSKKDQANFRDLSPESAYDTRFFTVWFDNSGEVTSWHLGNIATVDAEEAQTYGKRVIEEKTKAGFIGDYRYRKVVSDNETMVIFLNRRDELMSFQNTVITSISISAAGLAAVFILVVIFSRIVFRPVAEGYQKQKRFITDAGHEIKTPLTIIDANTEVIEMEYGASRWTASIRNQVHRMNTLTGQLITLSKLEEVAESTTKEEFSLSELLCECMEPFVAVAITEKKEITVSAREDVFMKGDKKSINQLLNLLMDNAVKYSPQGSTIAVSLEKNGKKSHLEIRNETDDIPKGNLDCLFERFYRTDNSRNSKTGGTGIGLSVARAIVQAGKGKISAYSKDGRSIVVTVDF